MQHAGGGYPAPRKDNSAWLAVACRHLGADPGLVTVKAFDFRIGARITDLAAWRRNLAGMERLAWPVGHRNKTMPSI